MSAQDIRKKFRGYIEANRVFMEIREEIPASIMNTFLGVILWGEDETRDGPITILELSEKIGLPYTTVSRHLRYLGEYERVGKPGANLVKTEIYLMNRRQKTVSLTAKGKTVKDRIAFALGVEDNADN